MSDEDWVNFMSMWVDYKKSTNLQGEEAMLQLMDCCCEHFRRDHHRTYHKHLSWTHANEETKLAELKNLSVNMKSCKVNRVKQDTLEQEKGDPVISSETNPKNFNHLQEDFSLINKFKSH